MPQTKSNFRTYMEARIAALLPGETFQLREFMADYASHKQYVEIQTATGVLHTLRAEGKIRHVRKCVYVRS